MIEDACASKYCFSYGSHENNFKGIIFAYVIKRGYEWTCTF